MAISSRRMLRASSNTPNSGPQLPELGWSLNGEALSGPIQQSHYNNLANFSNGDVWARIGFSSDGNWQSNVNTYVTACRAAGMKILLRASFTNAVYSGSQQLDSTRQAEYGDFVRDMALYAKNTLGLTANDVVFEHPNESNGRVSGAAYAGAAANAYPKLKSVDPNFKIIGASENVYAGNWQTWLQDVYNAGYASASDGISFHNYDEAGNDARWTFMFNLLAQHGAQNDMVWLTEFGLSTAASWAQPNPQQYQADVITGVLEHLRDTYPQVTHAFIYADEDIPSRQSTDVYEANFGIYTNDTNGNITGAKLAVNAIKQLYGTL
jgi:hypothetical protein